MTTKELKKQKRLSGPFLIAMCVVFFAMCVGFGGSAERVFVDVCGVYV